MDNVTGESKQKITKNACRAAVLHAKHEGTASPPAQAWMIGAASQTLGHADERALRSEVRRDVTVG